MIRSCFLAGAIGALLASTACAQIPKSAETGMNLDALYLHLHQNPELSFKEKDSATLLAAEAKSLGFKVTTGLGEEWVAARAKKEAGYVVDGVGGYGVVAIMENGDGPTLMIRADMDALPVPERTGKAYASTKTDEAWVTGEVPVMHACGHDVHMTVWAGVAREMAARKEEWSGTLMMILQPGEELGLGAKAMLEDGLFERFPYPDYNLALHVDSSAPAGVVGFVPEYAMANVDSVDIHVHGVGGHGAYPHGSKDPIVLSSYIVTALQTLVSREVDPLQSGVVTVGKFSGGHKHNIIPDEVELQLTVRSYTDEIRAQLLSGIERIAKAQALSFGLPEDKMPEISIKEDYTPAVYNHPELTARAVSAIKNAIGDDNVFQGEPVMGGEDFARYGRTDPKIPSFMFRLGAAPQEAYDAAMNGGAPLPPLHSPYFAPDYEPTIKTGVISLTAAAMDILGE